MQYRTAIEIPYPQIAGFCQRWGVSEFSLFGSVIRDDFGPDSDVDLTIVWDTLHLDLPILIAGLERILPPEGRI